MKDKYEAYVDAKVDAKGEAQVCERALSHIEGHVAEGWTCEDEVHQPEATNTRGSDRLDAIFCYGTGSEQIKPGIRKELSKLIIPSTHYDLPVPSPALLVAIYE